MSKDPQWTRWRELDDPISPLDIISPDSPRYEAGHIPAVFVVLLWDGHALRGPMKFHSQAEADDYLKLQPGVTHYLVLPKP
jgi:hypothetical protein